MDRTLREHKTENLVAVLAAVLVSVPASGSVEGDLESLRVVVKGHQTNLESLATWRGSAAVKHFLALGKDHKVWETHAVRFVYDREARSRRWNWSVLSVRRVLAGKEMRAPKSVHNKMVKGDGWYAYEDRNVDEKGVNGLEVNHAEKMRASNLSTDFDPLYYFKAAGDEVGERVMFYVDSASDPRLTSRVEVTSEGSLVTLTIRMGTVVNRYTFDLSKGCNCVAFHGGTVDGADVADWDYDFESVNGVWVPKRAVLQQRSPTGDGTTQVIEREVSFSENDVNWPADPREFDLEKLGLQTGDSVYDMRLGLRYKYGDEPETVAAVGEGAGPPDEKRGRGEAEKALGVHSRRGLLVLCAVGVAGVAAVVAAIRASWRRSRRGNSVGKARN